MGWTKQIVEGILNEIKADDCYRRFYSRLPREDFDKIVQGNKNVDSFLQFFLNGVRDGEISAQEAVDTIAKYNEQDQLIKQAVQNKIKNGEYDTPIEVYYDIDTIKESGIVSRNKFAKEGLIKLGTIGNGRYEVTCTINYEANHHYFGDSQWCTASDRLGRYDGYKMFVNYTIGSYGDASLVQVMDTKIKKNGFQTQFKKNGQFGSTMDYSDDEVSFEEFFKNDNIVEEFLSLLEGKSKKLFELTVDMLEKEDKYEKSREESLKKKKERTKKKKNDKIQKLTSEAEEYNNKKKEEILSNLHSLVSNPNFITKELIYKILEEYYNSNEEDGRSEESLKSTYYLDLLDTSTKRVGNHYVKLYNFCVNFGDLLGIDGDILFEPEEYSLEEIKLVIKSYHDEMYTGLGNGFSILCSEKDDEDGIGDILFSTGFLKEGFETYIIPPEKFSHYAGFNMPEKGHIIIYDFEENKKYVFDGAEKDREFIGGIFNDSDYALFWTNRNYRGHTRYAVINRRTGQILIDREDDTFTIEGTHSRFNGEYVFRRIAGFFQNNKMIVFDANNSNIIEIECNEPLIVNAPLSYNNYEIFELYGRKSRLKNYFLQPIDSKGFVVFGNWTEFVDASSTKLTSIIRKKALVWYDIYEEKYFRSTGRSRNDFEECDKYGDTESDKIAKHNFEKWKEQGGHSKEAQKQMYQMWADRGNEPENFKAFDDWDETDNMAGKLKFGNQYLKFNPNKSEDLSNFGISGEPDERWTGGVGVKDPESFWGGKGKNSLYRLDRNGKPIDQPWNSEDEIPAEPSDRVGSKEQMREHFKSLLDKLLD